MEFTQNAVEDPKQGPRFRIYAVRFTHFVLKVMESVN